MKKIDLSMRDACSGRMTDECVMCAAKLKIGQSCYEDMLRRNAAKLYYVCVQKLFRQQHTDCEHDEFAIYKPE